MTNYSVGFKIFDALALQTSDGEPCDCFCVVECCEKKYQTETLTERREMAVFNEACTWPEIQLYDKEFASASIEFSLYERNWFLRNKLIGRASLQLSYINNRRNHLYARTWLQMRTSDETDIKGQLNVSVFCIGAGQSAPSATEQMQVSQEEEEPSGADGKKKETEDDIRNMVLSTDVKAPPGKPHYVFINIHRVEDLAPTSYGSLPCPFVTVEFNGSQVTTRTAPEVEQYSFMESAKIPVMTPIYEDTIIIKLWSRYMLYPDELLAQGLISFSELRNNALAPQWFNVYGWDMSECPDLASIAASGEAVKPNRFKGRILISGRVEKVEDCDLPLQPAQKVAARTAEEPSTTQMAVMADAYMVVGLSSRTCKVQISYGKYTMDTEAVYAGVQMTDIKSTKPEESNDEVNWGLEDTVGIFNFSETEGRLKPSILCMTPDNGDSQPEVMVNVLTAGRFDSYARVGWCMRKLSEFTQYDQGNPARPCFLALEAMPGVKTVNTGSSVLITIEYNSSDDVIRHRRKDVRPMLYIVRAYVFMARNIVDGSGSDEPGNYSLRVLCSGMTNKTEAQTEVRPLWMQHLDIKVVLFSNSRSEPPTVEPITVSLMNEGGISSTEIGKASCVYTQMRKKDTLDKWEPYNLNPQWIQVFGGQYGAKPVGEVLIGFELLMWKNREEPKLAPREMWPMSEDNFVSELHHCRLKQATLHFSMMGLRDLPPLAGVTGGHIAAPEIEVSLPSWRSTLDDSYTEPEVLSFKYEASVPGGDARLKENQLKTWKSKKGVYAQGGMLGSNDTMSNFEFLKYGKMNIEIPEKMLFQPWICIKVFEGGGVVFSQRVFVGESLQSLHDHLPCCWYPGVDVEQGFDLQSKYIRQQIQSAKEESSARPAYEQMSKEEFELFLQQERKAQLALAMANDMKLVKMDKEAPARIDNFAIPIELRHLSEDIVRLLPLMDSVALNMQREAGFSPRQGPDIRQQGGEVSRPTYHGKLENNEDYAKHLWFRNVPLLRNKDVIPRADDTVDWQYGSHNGFIKCTYKLVDGWEEEEEEGEDGEDGGKSDDDDDDPDKVETDEIKLRQTFGLDPELVKFAFDKDKFVQKFKSSENVPARVRVRIYLLKAICIFAKNEGFADPYVELQLGRNNSISMKNLRDPVATNTPNFNIMQERDVELPMDSRLDISIMDYEQMRFSDVLVGSTTIDLEDRWHSKKWKVASERQLVPIESRNCFVPGKYDKNSGAMEMFIEMLESSAASDKKPSLLVTPADTLIEIRIVIRSAEVMTLGEDEFMDVSVGCMLECDKYEGPFPQKQETDVHYHSDGACKYDWRIVFPQIRTPVLNCIIEIHLYKYALLAGNTTLGTVRLDFKRYVERVSETMDKVDLPAVPLKMQGGPNDDPDEEIGTVTLEAVIMSDAEAQEMKAGIEREQPNQHPALFAPTEGRGWDAYLAGMGLGIPWPSWWKKLIPLVITAALFLASVVLMKQMGLM